MTSATLPVLAGGCFWTQYYGGEDVVRVAAELAGYYALCFFLALYGISLLALLPGRRRAALPHRSNTLSEIISWVYHDEAAEPALGDKKKGKGRKSEKHNSYTDPHKIRYGFGIHVGRDGLEHLGIDRVHRGGERSGRELVIWEEQQKSKRKSWTSQA